MKILRCCICNYTNEDGSDLLDQAPSRQNKVQWNSKFNEFQCFKCSREIYETLDAFERIEDHP